MVPAAGEEDEVLARGRGMPVAVPALGGSAKIRFLASRRSEIRSGAAGGAKLTSERGMSISSKWDSPRLSAKIRRHFSVSS